MRRRYASRPFVIRIYASGAGWGVTKPHRWGNGVQDLSGLKEPTP
jgi:hypothetical protein